MNEPIRITTQAQVDVVKLFGIEYRYAHSWINANIRKSERVSADVYRYGEVEFVTQRNGQRVHIQRVRRIGNETTTNGDVIIDGITIRKHAIERANERFRIPKSFAAQWIYDRFRESELVASGVFSGDNEGHLFAVNGIALAVAPDMKTIRTVMYNTKRFPDSLSAKISEITAKELRKIERKINAFRKRLAVQEAALIVERAERAFDLVRTRSVAKRMACQARINAIDMFIAEQKRELALLIEEKKRIAYTLIAV